MWFRAAGSESERIPWAFTAASGVHSRNPGTLHGALSLGASHHHLQVPQGPRKGVGRPGGWVHQGKGQFKCKHQHLPV